MKLCKQCGKAQYNWEHATNHPVTISNGGGHPFVAGGGEYTTFDTLASPRDLFLSTAFISVLIALGITLSLVLK